MKKEEVSFKIENKEVKLETGVLAKQADAAILATSGESRVLVTVVSSKQDSKLDFFPLTVEYSEKFYSIGRFPGGYFKREGRPTNEAILNCRLIDRPLRPCFPANYNYETQVIVNVLSYDGNFPANSLASIATSAAFHISDIPLKAPLAAFQVSRVRGALMINPSFSDLSHSDMSIFMAGHAEGILMVEGHSHFISEEELLEALKFGHKAMAPVLEAQEELRRKTGSIEKRLVLSEEKLGADDVNAGAGTSASADEDTGLDADAEFSKKIRNFLEPEIQEAFRIKEKKARTKALSQVKEKMSQEFLSLETDSKKGSEHQKDHQSKGVHKSSEEKQKALEKRANGLFEEVKYDLARKMILDDKKRIDGRGFEDIRPISSEVFFLPRTHGSSLFTRGETQVLSVVTLGTPDDEQQVDSLDGILKKKFMLHYNFPPFCVGEIGRLGQSRREIGHGFLAERALEAVIPDQKKFPYVIRIVSEVLESNGSSSMGTVCSGTLALLDAGVPIEKNIAGIAMGLVKEKNGERVAILSDILGDEDHLGDMDFKVAGARDGITALQMDIKIEGISFEILEKALMQAKKGREHILNEMEKTMSKPKETTSKYAPKITNIRVKPAKVKDVIGAGGKVIKGIIEKTGVRINIEDDGLIHISSLDPEATDRAIKMIKDLSAEAEVGKTYKGKVTKITDFGAFVEVLPNTSGLVHISEIAHERIRKVSDVLKEGDTIDVKVLDVDRAGRIKLSRKALLSSSRDREDRERREFNN